MFFSLRAMLTPYICRQMQRASMAIPVNAPKYEEETIKEQQNKQEGKNSLMVYFLQIF